MSNLDNLLNQIKKSLQDNNSDFYLNRQNYIKNLKETFKEENSKFSAIFTVLEQPQFNLESLKRLEYMINMSKEVNKKEITEHDASVKVGQRLVDDIVKPQLKD